jgi:hypothetical protein
MDDERALQAELRPRDKSRCVGKTVPPGTQGYPPHERLGKTVQ